MILQVTPKWHGFVGILARLLGMVPEPKDNLEEVVGQPLLNHLLSDVVHNLALVWK